MCGLRVTLAHSSRFVWPRDRFPVRACDMLSAHNEKGIGRQWDEDDPDILHRHRSAVAGRGDMAVIRVGIVGCNYGRTVLLPAFRAERTLRGRGACRNRRCADGRAGARGQRCAWARRLARAGRGSRGRGRRHRGSAGPPARGRVPRARSRQAGLRGEAAGRRSAGRAGHARIRAQERTTDGHRFQFSRAAVVAARQGDIGCRRGRTPAPRGRDLERRKPGDAGAPRKLEDARRRRRRSPRQFRLPLLPLSRMALWSDLRRERPCVPIARSRRREQHCAGTGVCLGRRRQPADELCVLPRLRSPYRALWRRRHVVPVKSHRRLLPRLRADAWTPWRSCVAAGRDRGYGRRSRPRFEDSAGVASGTPLHRGLRNRRLGFARLRRGLSRAMLDRRGAACTRFRRVGSTSHAGEGRA